MNILSTIKLFQVNICIEKDHTLFLIQLLGGFLLFTDHPLALQAPEIRRMLECVLKSYSSFYCILLSVPQTAFG